MSFSWNAKGTTYTMRVAKFGEPFVTEEVQSLNLGDEVYVGLFLGSHNKDVVEKGIYSDVRITYQLPPNSYLTVPTSVAALNYWM